MLPVTVENAVDSIDCWEDGNYCVGTSNLSGPFWTGALWCFQPTEDVPSIGKRVTGIETEAGIAQVLCLKDNKVALGMDSGTLELYQLVTDSAVFGALSYACEHDDVVSTLSVNSNQTCIISGSYDKSIKVWDIDAWCSLTTYRPAHAGIVWQVAFSAIDPQVFLSCSQDGKIMIWDLRMSKPATVLNKGSLVDVPTAVSWQPGSSAIYAAGDCSGQVVLRDLRGSGDMCECRTHKRGIFRLAFCPTKPSLLAVCADDTEVKVVSTDKDSIVDVYYSDVHTDFVRGLSWTSDDMLVTSGWDKQVFKHTVLSSDMEVASPNCSEL